MTTMTDDPLVALLMELTRSGGEWILWLLVGLSVWVTAILIERYLLLRKEIPALMAYRDGKTDSDTHLPDRVQELFDWIEDTDAAAPEVEARIASTVGQERRRLSARLGTLGTLGANAPFIGLLGTVLGIVEAFRSLAEAGGNAGPTVVMAGISEALVATAMGLAVAIPCVIGYNGFSRWISSALDDVEEKAKLTFTSRRSS